MAGTMIGIGPASIVTPPPRGTKPGGPDEPPQSEPRPVARVATVTPLPPRSERETQPETRSSKHRGRGRSSEHEVEPEVTVEHVDDFDFDDIDFDDLDDAREIRRRPRRVPRVERSPSRALALRPRGGQLISPAEVEIERVHHRARRAHLPPLGNYQLGRIITEHLEDGPVDDRLVMLTDHNSPAAEAYRALFYRLGATTEARTFMVTTPSDEQDSSICAANLALAIALGSEERVLLVETRFQPPSLADLFAYQPSECFGRRLADHRRRPDAPWRVAQLSDTGLSLLCLDPRRAVPPALDAQALKEVIDGLYASGFSYIIVDAPALTKGSDARFVSRCVDGTILAVHGGRTRQRQIDESIAALDGSPLVGYAMFSR